MEFFKGFVISAGLIVAIGSQNAWVLGMSVRRFHAVPIALLCASIDAILMAVGVFLFARVGQFLPLIYPWLILMAVSLLMMLCVQAIKRVVSAQSGLQSDFIDAKPSLKQALLTVLALSLFNPHVYLDTVVLIGSLASASQAPFWFWSGGALASFVWFSLLAWAGKPLSRWLTSPRRWQIFDSIIALAMFAVAVQLLLTL